MEKLTEKKVIHDFHDFLIEDPDACVGDKGHPCPTSGSISYDLVSTLYVDASHAPTTCSGVRRRHLIQEGCSSVIFGRSSSFLGRTEEDCL